MEKQQTEAPKKKKPGVAKSGTGLMMRRLWQCLLSARKLDQSTLDKYSNPHPHAERGGLAFANSR